MNWEISKIDAVECVGEFDDEYVYDIEMSNDNHTFFANNILVHNSCYLNVQPIVDHVIGANGKFTKKNIALICTELDKFVDKINNNCFEEIVKPVIGSNLNTIEFKREAFATEAAFLAKKRYIMHVRDSEGTPWDEFKYVGVEVKKVELPLAIRNCLKHIIENSLIDNWDVSKYHEEINKVWSQFKVMTPEEVGIYKGYTTAKDSSGFLQLVKGAGVHARAATYHNQLIDKLGLRRKYEDIKVGDRLQYVFLKPNMYGINCMGFNEKMPDEFKDMFMIDYELMFLKMVMKPLKLFCELQGWGLINPSEEVIQSVLNL